MKKYRFDEALDSELALKVQLLGANYLVAAEPVLNQIIFNHIEHFNNRTLLGAHINMHGIAVCRKDNDMRNYLEAADFHWIDGMPIALMLKALGYKVKPNWRITFLDWQKSFFALANQKYLKIYLLGSTNKNINSAENILKKRYPNIIFSSHHGYLETKREKDVAINNINTFNPDILLLGQGMPIQEQFALHYGKTLKVKVILPIGGYFDYVAGDTYTPPRWLGNLGLEWAARLASSPKRLAYRYLIEPIPILLKFGTDLAKRKLNSIGQGEK